MVPIDLSSRIDELESRLAAERAQVRDLAMMGTVITSILEIDALLSVTMDMGLRLVDGEVGLIMLHEDGALKSKVNWGVSGDFARSLKYEDGLDLATYSFENRRTVVLTDLGLQSPEGITLNSVIASPIQTKEGCLGVMIVINKSNQQNFLSEDKEILEMLLNFVAVGVENSLLVKDKLRQQKVLQEMVIAKQIQETILPADIDIVSDAQIGAAYYPARDVGGDFYDVIKLDEHRFWVILGDVSSKGVPAALIMSACSAVIKSVLAHHPEYTVSELAETVNDLMARQIIKDREMFVTLFFTSFDLRDGSLAYCNAGHLPGLFWNSRDQVIEPLSDGGPILGQFAGTSYKHGTRDIVTGDRLFLFTDGLTEATDSEGNLFGRERAEQVFTAEIGADPKKFCLRVKEWVDRFAQGAADDTHDDFTIVQVKVGEKMTEYTFSYPSNLESATRLVDDLENALGNHRIDQDLVRRMTLTVSEAFTNALIHGNREDIQKTVKVQVTVDRSLVTADICDEGTGGLGRIQARPQATSLAEGGRGIDLILHYASSAEFLENETGGLEVRLTFKREPDRERV